MTKAVLYCRVSTKEQVGNLSLATQQEACAEYCARNKMEVQEMFVEEGESAKTVDRPALKRLLTYCAAHRSELDVVVVYAVSRLARDTSDHLAIRAQLRRHGIQLRSVTEPIDDSSSGKFIETILAGVAQFDNDVRAERTKSGMRAA